VGGERDKRKERERGEREERETSLQRVLVSCSRCISPAFFAFLFGRPPRTPEYLLFFGFGFCADLA
jgi:hypothetical protein